MCTAPSQSEGDDHRDCQCEGDSNAAASPQARSRRQREGQSEGQREGQSATTWMLKMPILAERLRPMPQSVVHAPLTECVRLCSKISSAFQ
jgi:hypothetical protein